MTTNVEVMCIRKREHQNPHERIEGLGGVYADKRWYMPESDIVAELEKPANQRSWQFYTSVNGYSARVIVAVHNGRKYLKTENDGYSPDNLLSLQDCPK